MSISHQYVLGSQLCQGPGDRRRHWRSLSPMTSTESEGEFAGTHWPLYRAVCPDRAACPQNQTSEDKKPVGFTKKPHCRQVWRLWGFHFAPTIACSMNWNSETPDMQLNITMSEQPWGVTEENPVSISNLYWFPLLCRDEADCRITLTRVTRSTHHRASSEQNILAKMC